MKKLSTEKTHSYIELTRVFKKNNIELRRVNIESFDKNAGVFLDYGVFTSTGIFEIKIANYIPELIWNRRKDGQLYANTLLDKYGYKLFPSTSLTTIANDKYETYCFLTEYQPCTLLLQDFFRTPELRGTLTNKIVLKPIRSSSGAGILFFTQDQLLAKEDYYHGLGSLFIVQEFIDFSKGYPGLIGGIHDVRLIYIGGKFSNASMRTPKEGSLKSNVGDGGDEIHLRTSEIPAELFVLGKAVLECISASSQDILAVDFGYSVDKKRWYVFEINYSPGTYSGSDKLSRFPLFYEKYFQDMADMIQENF